MRYRLIIKFFRWHLTPSNNHRPRQTSLHYRNKSFIAFKNNLYPFSHNKRYKLRKLHLIADPLLCPDEQFINAIRRPIPAFLIKWPNRRCEITILPSPFKFFPTLLKLPRQKQNKRTIMMRLRQLRIHFQCDIKRRKSLIKFFQLHQSRT